MDKILAVVYSLSRVQLFCNSMDGNLSGSSVHRISQAKLLELVVISFSGAFPNPGIKPAYPALASRFFTTESPGKPCMPNGSPLFYTLNTSTEMVSIIIV